MKYEIMIRCPENEEKNKTMECEEFLVIAMTPDGEGVRGETYLNSSVHNMSMAIGDNGTVCAAARYAVARRDVERDIKEERMQEKSKELMKVLAERDVRLSGLGIL